MKYLITLTFILSLSLSNTVFAKSLKIAFFASSSENGYNQATWEGVKDAAAKHGDTETAIYNGEFNATLQYAQIEDIIVAIKEVCYI